MPMAPEDNVEMAPAADERIEAQRVGQAGHGGAPQLLAPALEPGCPRLCVCLTLCVCQGAPQAKGYVLRERAPAKDPQEHIKVRARS